RQQIVLAPAQRSLQKGAVPGITIVGRVGCGGDYGRLLRQPLPHRGEAGAIQLREQLAVDGSLLSGSARVDGGVNGKGRLRVGRQEEGRRDDGAAEDRGQGSGEDAGGGQGAAGVVEQAGGDG